ncbi:MAG: CHAT domain-containing protein [Candidatus Helarchaeota archaeon]
MEQEEIQIENTKVRIYNGDIRDLNPEVLVSSDNTEFSMDSGVAKALLERGGPQILQEVQNILARKKIVPGDVVVTNAGNLSAKKIFHCAVCDDNLPNPVVTPHVVILVVHKCLEMADNFAYKSIAFPAIGTGPNQIDSEVVSKSMIQKVFDYLRTTATGLGEVTFSLYEKADWQNFFREFWKTAAEIKFEAEKPIRLTILRQNQINYLDLTSSETISYIKTMKVSNKTLTKYAHTLEEFVTNGKSKYFKSIKRFGLALYNELLEDVGPKLKRIPSENLFLKLDDDLLTIPWELCYDGEEYLGLKYNMGRQVVVSPKFYIRSYRTRSLQFPLRVLLLADPTETLPGAREECSQIHDALSKIDGIKEYLEFREGTEIKMNRLLKDLTNYDLIHFAGHAYFDKENPKNSGWVINADRREFLTGEMLAAHTAPPIVFANACESGVAAVDERRFQSDLFGIASGFLMGGIKNYIGTFTYINDTSSVKLAVEFYKRLISEGETVGSALRHARQLIFDKYGESDLLWASYMLYGDPEFSLKVK